jgi:hypothetical protein
MQGLDGVKMGEIEMSLGGGLSQAKTGGKHHISQVSQHSHVQQVHMSQVSSLRLLFCFLINDAESS